MRYSIKSLSIGYECPFVDLSNKKWNEELGSNISNSYSNFFDILKNDLELMRLPNGNLIFLYNLVAMIDNNTITRRQLDSEWGKLEDTLSKVISEFLEKQNVEYYRKLN